MPETFTLGGRLVGPGCPVFVTAEIGLNHNGDVNLAVQLIDAAVRAGCDAVKFQKRSPELCVPPEMRDAPRQTPWGTMTYLDYRRRIELGSSDFEVIDRHCRDRGITWYAACWDEPSVDFIGRFDPPAYKVASACLTDHALLCHVVTSGRPLLLSTGMSTLEEIDAAVGVVPRSRLLLYHSTSTYPCPPEQLNLRMVPALVARYGCPVGYSGHERDLAPTLAAVALGACMVERHITLDHTLWGSDHAASLEPDQFARLVCDIKLVSTALGDGVKAVYPEELPIRAKLRRVK
jgi:N-acetylneuraminate synthase